MSESGQTCLMWVDVPDEALSSLGLPTDTVPSENYCRNPDNSTSSYVGCFHDTASGVAWESCLVPYCGECYCSVVDCSGESMSNSLLNIVSSQLEEMCAIKSMEGSASTGHAVQLVTLTKATTHVVCARSLETPPFAAKAFLPAT